MPELPEVETVKRRLEPFILNKTIEYVEVFYSKYSHLECIKNEKIRSMDRKGKFLIFNLDNYNLISHLRMEGKYFLKTNPVKEKHDLVFFHLDSGETLIYNDTRKFGVFNLFDKDVDIFNEEPLKKLGIEPFNASVDYFIDKIKNSNEPIKSILLDQSILAGFGNIYANEVLYMSKINPYKKGKDITKEEAQLLINNGIIILNNAITAGGSTIKSFNSFNGEVGHFQNELLVHSKEGEKCPNCGNIIMKTAIGGRGTYFCPTCQGAKKYYGITGSFASGKSTVLKILKELGYETYSCDEIYNELFMNSKKMIKEIHDNFNTNSKAELREIVYNDKNKNELLKSITHKYIFMELNKRIFTSDSNIAFVEVPLLFEGEYEKIFDKTISVLESDSVNELILKIRNVTPEFKKYVMNSQLSKEEKAKKADYVLNNDGSIASLKKEVKKLLKQMEV